ncbi:Rhodanese-related sulfurtransferase [hydrothermal vent metagenome]|uniref:Rhodanese-related sulfurtransferase n=1 Tax=hydrothermal vent metagenome TaxID=652676 RepID=A0A3B1A738_9ZZZZ
MKTFNDLISEVSENVKEIFPWDLEEILEYRNPLLLDIRENYEFATMHLNNSINVPRGILETACEYNFDETIPELVSNKEQEIIVICRSGNRSILATDTMQQMGYTNVCSLKTGVRGWNEYDQELYDNNNNLIDPDDAEECLKSKVRDDQLDPNN